MKILELYPNIARAIVARFPYLIVDEAQDTSDIQMRIIDLLIENGLTEVMFVGDPDQAIFEWNDAKPELLTQKFDEWDGSIVLNESRRSSQRICNFTFGISSLDVAATAVNQQVKEFGHHPQIITYGDNLQQIVSGFILECQQQGINVTKDSTAVIFRSKSIENDIFGLPRNTTVTDVWTDGHTREFARGKFLYDNGKVKEGFKIIERVLLRKLNNLSYCSEVDIDKVISSMGFVKYKSQIFKFINLLPKTDVAIGDWVGKANAAIAKTKCKFQLSLSQNAGALTFGHIFQRDNKQTIETNYRYGTVHSVKGETFEAVLLILKTKGAKEKAYNALLNENVHLSTSEELRIAYVGMTRPSKILVLAVPNEDHKTAWERRLS